MRVKADLLRLLSRLLGKGAAFFFLLSLLLASTYLLGSFQEFLDSSQLFLLRGLEVVLLLEVVFSALYIGFLLMKALVQGRFLILPFFLTFLSMAFCFGLLLSLKFLSAWFQL
jgi:hypothetical protein